MPKEEILNHRKNKFLAIGRSKGFVSKSNISQNLSMKENFLSKIINIISNQKKLIIYLLIAVVLLFFLIIAL